MQANSLEELMVDIMKPVQRLLLLNCLGKKWFAWFQLRQGTWRRLCAFEMHLDSKTDRTHSLFIQGTSTRSNLEGES